MSETPKLIGARGVPEKISQLQLTTTFGSPAQTSSATTTASAISVQGRAFIAPKSAEQIFEALGLPPCCSLVARQGEPPRVEFTACDMVPAGDYEVREPWALEAPRITVRGRFFRAPKRAREILAAFGANALSLVTTDGSELISSDFVGPGKYDIVVATPQAEPQQTMAASYSLTVATDRIADDKLKQSTLPKTDTQTIAVGSVPAKVTPTPLAPRALGSASMVNAQALFDAWAERSKSFRIAASVLNCEKENEKEHEKTQAAETQAAPVEDQSTLSFEQSHDYQVFLPVLPPGNESPDEEEKDDSPEPPMSEQERRRKRAEDLRSALVVDVVQELQEPTEEYEQDQVRVEMRQPNGISWVFYADEENTDPDIIGCVAALMLGIPAEECDVKELVERIYEEGNDFPVTKVYKLIKGNSSALFPEGIHGTDQPFGKWYELECTKLIIEGAGDDMFEIRVPLAMHVGHAQRIVAERRGIPPGRVQLLWNGKQLVCDRTLEEYGITERCNLRYNQVACGGKYAINLAPPRCLQRWIASDKEVLSNVNENSS